MLVQLERIEKVSYFYWQVFPNREVELSLALDFMNLSIILISLLEFYRVQFFRSYN